MSIRLSAAVWRDLTSSFFQWEGASAVRELVRKAREKARERRGRRVLRVLVFIWHTGPLAPPSLLA